MNLDNFDGKFDANIYDVETRTFINSKLIELLIAKYVSDSKDPAIEWRNLSVEIFAVGDHVPSSVIQDDAGNTMLKHNEYAEKITSSFIKNIRCHLEQTFPTEYKMSSRSKSPASEPKNESSNE